jgi:hypothetical protein
MLEESRIEARVQMRPSSSGATSAHLMVCGWVHPTPERPTNAVDAEPTPYFFAVPGLTGSPVDRHRSEVLSTPRGGPTGYSGGCHYDTLNIKSGKCVRAYAHHLDACLKS